VCCRAWRETSTKKRRPRVYLFGELFINEWIYCVFDILYDGTYMLLHISDKFGAEPQSGAQLLHAKLRRMTEEEEDNN